MISIDLSETTQKKAHWKSETKFSKKQNSQDFFSNKIKKFFPTKKYFVRKNSWIFSLTEFCLGLHTAVVFRMQSLNFYSEDVTPTESI